MELLCPSRWCVQYDTLLTLHCCLTTRPPASQPVIEPFPLTQVRLAHTTDQARCASATYCFGSKHTQGGHIVMSVAEEEKRHASMRNCCALVMAGCVTTYHSMHNHHAPVCWGADSGEQGCSCW